MTTLKQAKEILKQHSVTIRKRDDEYRVNFKDGQEASAYYTNDINDAVATGITMRRHEPNR